MPTNLHRRLKVLENRRSRAPETFRVIIGSTCGDTDLGQSNCTRYVLPDGSLMEILNLCGSGDELSLEDLERFIARFPNPG